MNDLTKEQISAFMKEMGRRGGLIGGKRRLETMTPEARSAAGLHAARARWGAINCDNWSREGWPVGTLFSYGFVDGSPPWEHCVLTKYTSLKVYWRYPVYDGPGPVGTRRRCTVVVFAEEIRQGRITREY